MKQEKKIEIRGVKDMDMDEGDDTEQKVQGLIDQMEVVTGIERDTD